MATVASMNVLLKADSKAFISGMRGAIGSLKNMGEAVIEAGVKVAKFGGILGTAAAAGLAALTKTNMDALNGMAEFADSIGIGVERLQELEFAAQTSGVDIEKLRGSLQTMTRLIADAADGSGKAEGALEDLGLSAKFLKQLAPDQQFKVLADALDQVKSSGDRARLAFKLFGTEGVALLNTMRGGSAALERTAEEARSLGFVLGGSALARIKAADDSFDKLKLTLSVFGRVLAAEVAPIFKVVVDRLQGFAGGLDLADKAKIFVEFLVHGFIKIGVFAHQTFVDIKMGLGKLIEDVGKLMGVLSFGSAGGTFKELGASLQSSAADTMISDAQAIAMNGVATLEELWFKSFQTLRFQAMDEAAQAGESITQSLANAFQGFSIADLLAGARGQDAAGFFAGVFDRIKSSAASLPETFMRIRDSIGESMRAIAETQKSARQKIAEFFFTEEDKKLAEFKTRLAEFEKMVQMAGMKPAEAAANIERAQEFLRKDILGEAKTKALGAFQQFDPRLVSPAGLARTGKNVEEKQLGVLQQINAGIQKVIAKKEGPFAVQLAP